MTRQVPADTIDQDDVGVALRRALRVIPDFPSPGIAFQDITPVLGDAALFARTIGAMADSWRQAGVTHVAGIESRGFILAAPIALELGAGLIPVRKPGKLPAATIAREYSLEYGTGALHVHADACGADARVLVVDDVLATGGTAAAACELIEALGARVVGCAVLLAISALRGEARLDGRSLAVLIRV